MYTTYLTLIVPALIAAIVTYVSVLFLKSYMLSAGVSSIDHYKKNKPTMPGSGGVAVAFGFAVGLMAYVFGSSFKFYFASVSIVNIFAVILSVVLISFVGLLDDINVKGTLTRSTDLMDKRKGLEQWQKPLLTLIGAVPLMVANAGVSLIKIPFIGLVDFGIFYPIMILPLAVIFVSNAFNLLGGFDGLSAGTGALAALALLIYSLLYGNSAGALVSAVLLTATLVFFYFNKYPAQIHPGDSFTYGFGAAFVAAVVIGNMEAFGIIVFAPFIIEFVLHLTRKFNVTDLGKIRSDGTFDPPYGKKIYGWTHFIMNLKRCTEPEVSMYMWIIEIAFIVLAFALKAAAFL